MKPTFRQEKYAGMVKPALQGFLAVCCLGAALNASAVVEDDPYYKLYPTPAGEGSGPVSVCGTLDCDTTGDYMQVQVVTGGPTGTGVVNSFLRQMEPNNAGQSTDGTSLGTETSYNTNFGTLQQDPTFDNDAQDAPSAGNPWNRAILLSDLLSEGGFYDFFLDLNEPGNGTDKKYIKMDEFEIHLSSTGLLHEYDPDSNLGGGELGAFDDASGYLGKVFDMDYWNSETPYADGRDSLSPDAYGGVIMDNCVGDKGCGSGDKDYLFRLPVSLFETGAEGPVYVHLVSGLGEGTYREDGVWEDAYPEAFADAGFDEWWTRECEGDCGGGGGEEIPVPGTALLFGLGLMGIYSRRRKQA